ncbi:MAG: SulP family inorganic anion transporter [Burkholderiales bacterium]
MSAAPSSLHATPSLAVRLFPWLRTYGRADARDDALAGSTLAAYAVPSSIAYAQLAGMPVATGLYCYLFAGIAYALTGSCRQLAVGPTSSIALTLAVTLSGMAAGDPARYAELATATALFVGLTALFAWAMRWGGIVHFISETVLTGFKIGAGTVIAISQIPLLLGFAGQHGDLVATLVHIGRNLPNTHVPSLVLGVTALVLLQVGHWWKPRWPVPLIVVALSLVLMTVPGIDRFTIATVGAIPAGLPLPALPHMHWGELGELLPLSLACFLLAYNEGIAAARLLALRHEYAVDPNRELLGLGAANVAIALGHGFPSAGGLSQSLVNDEARARTPVSLVVCSAWMAIVLVFLTGLFDVLPQPLLAALVLASVQSMFKIDELRQLRRVSKAEFVIAMVTILAVLGVGILKGVLVACVFSLAMLIRRLALPECVLMGRIPGTDHFASLVRHPTAQVVPGIVVFRPNAALLYFNVDNVREHMLQLLTRAEPPLRRIIVDLSFTTELDLSTIRMLIDFARRAQEDGVAVLLADAHYRVRALLAREKNGRLLGDMARAYSIAELVDGLQYDVPLPRDAANGRAAATL